MVRHAVWADVAIVAARLPAEAIVSLSLVLAIRRSGQRAHKRRRPAVLLRSKPPDQRLPASRVLCFPGGDCFLN
jgi:hypothetical protein